MANSEAGSSSDAARAIGGEYQVFLNFRGSDTRYGFTDFLYHGLVDAGVRVFMDETELGVGEVIGENLLRAINNSKIYIPIFSQTYASSKWCLRELVHIVDNASKSESQKSIFPIFLDVEPEDIKLKTPRYSDALLEHEKKFPVEVKLWRKALAEVDEIKGWNVKKDESQATIVKLVVKRVLEKLKLKQRLVPEHLVGLDDRVKHLTELLDVNHRDVRLIGIYGMGGIGKTTVAKVVFNELLSHFGKCSSFLENVREKMSTEDGIVQLQKKLLSDIADSGSAEGVQESEQGMRRIGEVLSTKKVLVVLDDADNKDHIKRLIGNNSLHSGSRIIITTRNHTILQGHEFKDEIIQYEMLEMDDASALELFCRHAFGKTFPSDDYHALSNEIVSSTGGLPLAVEVIGSLLNKKDKAFWEETMIKLRNVPEEEILEKLRISYDDLNEHQQQIFLDIACFFFNEKKTDAIYMWADCDFYPVRGIDVLTSRCLIKIFNDDKFWMHDQLIYMGRRIVHQESPNDPSKRSRVWIAKEALEIIRTEERKNEVEALEIEGSLGIYTGFIHITNEEFEKFPNLRFLKLKLATFIGDFARCHSKLKWISLHSPSHLITDFRANNIYFNDLVVFKLDYNYFKDDSKAWDLIKGARKLKVLSLRWCDGITTIPNFSECLELERLTIANCQNLKKIESFIGKLQSLIELEIEGCRYLTDLPDEVGALGKLECFSLRGCFGLRELPGSLRNLTSLKELDLSNTSIRELPNSLGNLTSLKKLDLSNTSIWELPNSLGNLTSLKELDLSHTSIRELPSSLGNLTSLKELDLSKTSIRELPSSIGKLKSLCVLRFAVRHRENHAWYLPKGIGMLINLEELDLSGHKEMKGEIPYGIEGLSSLKILNLKSTGICGIPKTIDMLHHLQMLDLSNCHDIQELPKFPTSLTCLRIQSESLLSVPNLSYLTRLDELQLSNYKFAGGISKPITGCNLCWIEGLSKLKKLTLCLLGVLGPLELAYLPHLEFLNLAGLDLKTLMQLPSSTSSWKYLWTLSISHCEVEDILLEGLPQLEELNVHSCIRLQRLFILSKLLKLRRVSVSLCRELVEIRVVDLSESLKIMDIHHCESLTRISGLLYLKNLESLKIHGCHVLTNVEGLAELESLKYLEVAMCKSLGRLIDASCTKIPDNCLAYISKCGDHIKDFGHLHGKLPLKLYKEDILQNEAERDVSRPDEDSDSASVDESETDGNSSIDDFQPEPTNAECFEAPGNRSQMKDERVGHSGAVNGGKTTSMENRKEEKDESGEPANQSDVVC
ncbi:disease resistance protein RUN1-like isoform X1 [Eucalyptus grandis]|uniref:disease resistance protein RUN1-like isoform X1 n=1 Tax=Eucalyptus grandis TaxID=71139 RepID=UPI00192EE026|nr:disease resistance protein RUN1-like isoform X1 [Eucalyptus grandis]